MDRTREKWERFTIRHKELFKKIKREVPGFWTEVKDLWHCHLEETVTTRGAVVREFPATREMGTQTDNAQEEVKGRRMTSDKGVQTPCLNLPLAALEAAADRMSTGEERTASARTTDRVAPVRNPGSQRPKGGPTHVSPSRRSLDCWNCGAQDHRYNACPKPKRHEFCYRCGEEGLTLRDCPRCHNEWQEEGPYRPGRSVPRDPARRAEGRR